MWAEGRRHELEARLKVPYPTAHLDAILLSGGLDSSILASVFRPKYAITVGFGSDAEDLTFSEYVAKRFCKYHVKVFLNTETLLSIMEKLIELMKTFDPIEIRNSSVLYAGIEESKRRGLAMVLTGDGCDELFAGYDYMRRLDNARKDMELELIRLWQVMRFSSHQIGDALGVRVLSPYLEKPFSDYARSIDISEKVGSYRGKNWGKFVLRKCFEQELGEDIAWRSKRAQEKGANITTITGTINEAFYDDEFLIEKTIALSEGVSIRDKEHLYYYLLYRRMFPPPGTEYKASERRCPNCLCQFKWKGRYCRTCGSYPVLPTIKRDLQDGRNEVVS
jgi:asparagine synthase (glutamine-hydrolysing)